MAVAGFGKPKFGKSGGSFAKSFKIETDDKGGTTHNVYRIIPPMKSLAESGQWAFFDKIHYGYRGVDKMDPTKGKLRTFRCIEDFDFSTKIIRRECDECEKIKAKKALLEPREAEIKAKNKTLEDKLAAGEALDDDE